jgi:exodeoxyribonuclease-5
LLDALKDRAKKSPKSESGLAWKRYYKYKRAFLDCSYGYAITAHKSQGSTYTNAVLLEYDMLKNSNTVEMNRIRYTALTRANKRVIIIS